MDTPRPIKPTQSFNNTLQLLFVFLYKKTRSDSVRDVQTSVNAVVRMHPFKLIEAAIPHMLQHSNMVIQKNDTFFLEQSKKASQNGELSNTTSRFLDVLGDVYQELSEKDQEFVWSQVSTLLNSCAVFQFEINKR